MVNGECLLGQSTVSGASGLAHINLSGPGLHTKQLAALLCIGLRQ